ncbi:protein-L-isoaspartate O-methyltransferase, partial [archaeon]|nr:protein-L-isoaspartate O-methyltransferase [archaeon]
MDAALARQNMVKSQLQARDIHDTRVLNAFQEVPRHTFVEEYLKYKAYEDYPLS